MDGSVLEFGADIVADKERSTKGSRNNTID